MTAPRNSSRQSDELSRSERRRYAVIMSLVGVLTAIPLMALAAAISSGESAEPWLNGAALGLGLGVGAIAAHLDLCRRRGREESADRDSVP